MYLGGTRSTQQCCMRWHSKIKTQVGDFKIGEWSQDELKLLKESVEMYSGKGRGGKINWTKVEQRFGGTRSAKQCCNRWKNNGKPFGYPPDEVNALVTASVIFAGASGEKAEGIHRFIPRGIPRLVLSTH